MILKEIILKNYTRLYVAGIKELEYRPEKNMQILLGKNGSGKSSLLKEIIPNVEDLNLDYEKGGYKKVTYLHNNKTIILGYTKDKNKHSFIVDGEELNPVGLKKTQKILIEEHFNLSKPIHELLLSTTTLTNMSVSERKKWFTEILSDIDYEYALNLYNKVKIKVRDLTSYIKLTQNKILQDEEYFKNITKDDLNLLKKDKDIFNKLINDLLSVKKNLPNIDKPNINEYLDINNKLTTLLNKVNKYNLTTKEVNDNLIIVDNDIKHYEELVKNITKDISNITIIDDGEFNTVKLKDKINNLNNKINKIGIVDFNTIEELIHKIELFKSVYTNLVDYISEYVNIDSININELSLVNLKQNIEFNKNKINEVNTKINIIEKDIAKQNAFKSKGEVTCPKCSNIFIPNYDEITFNNLKDKSETLNNEKNNIKKITNELEDKYNLLNNKLNILNNIELTINNLDNKLKNKIRLYLKDEKTLLNNISNLYITLPDTDKLTSIKNDINETNKRLDLIADISREKVKENDRLKDKLNDKRIEYINIINKKNKEKNFYLTLRNIYTSIFKHKELLESFNSRITKYKKNAVDLLYNEYYNEVISLCKAEVYVIEEKIAKYKNIEEHYKNLKIELDKYKLSLEVNKKLENYLSPNKGIIGTSISNTINLVLENMNYIINQIWSYEINILPCIIENNDLTYRFPVKIGDVKTIPDINKGSSSIKEVIDLSFKLTAMEILDMLDYPLILDEFSKTMDETNRIASYGYIEQLNKQHFNQIFLVSHFQEMYSRFLNTDVVILDNSNIGYSGEFNSVMKIKK